MATKDKTSDDDFEKLAMQLADEVEKGLEPEKMSPEMREELRMVETHVKELERFRATYANVSCVSIHSGAKLIVDLQSARVPHCLGEDEERQRSLACAKEEACVDVSDIPQEITTPIPAFGDMLEDENGCQWKTVFFQLTVRGACRTHILWIGIPFVRLRAVEPLRP